MGHGWLDGIEHSFGHAVHDVGREIKKGTHKLKHETRYLEKTAESVGQSVEHGVVSDIGIVKKDVFRDANTVKNTVVTAVKGGAALSGQAEHWAAKTGKQAFALGEEGLSDIWKYEKEGAKTIWNFLDPFNWGISEWVLIGGGGLLIGYMLLKGGQTAVRVAPSVARGAAEAAPLLLI